MGSTMTITTRHARASRGAGVPSWRPAVVTMVATLGSWLTSWGIASRAGLGSDVIVLGTILPVTLSQLIARRTPASRRERLVRLASVPVVALAASEVGVMIEHHRWYGGAVFVAVLAASIWVRRFGALATSLGSLVSMPFIVLLVSPVAPAPGHEHTLWPGLIGLVALLWVVLLQEIGWRSGFVRRPPTAPRAAPAAPAQGLRASTKLAIQMGLGLGLSYALGTWWFPQHWPWMVLSAFVVASGNRGRGDVVNKGLLRLGGALVGTAGATLLATAFDTGDRWAVVLLFVVMVASVWLRSLSYAYWACGVTAMLALLHGYYGEHGIGLLGERLAGIALGAAMAVAIAWLVVPIRSRDSFRRRLADALAALAELLTALRTHPEDVTAARGDLDYAITQLELVEPAWRLHARVFGRRPGHPAELVRRTVELSQALRSVAPGTADRDEQVLWARRLGAVRKRLRRGDAGGPTEPERAPAHAEVKPGVGRVEAALDALETELTRDAWLRLGGG